MIATIANRFPVVGSGGASAGGAGISILGMDRMRVSSSSAGPVAAGTAEGAATFLVVG